MRIPDFPVEGCMYSYGRLRTYVQTSSIDLCESILTTDSDIIIGNNVPKAEEVAEYGQAFGGGIREGT